MEDHQFTPDWPGPMRSPALKSGYLPSLDDKPLHAYKILCDAFLSISTAEYGQQLADAVSATLLNAQASCMGLPITGPRGWAWEHDPEAQSVQVSRKDQL